MSAPPKEWSSAFLTYFQSEPTSFSNTIHNIITSNELPRFIYGKPFVLNARNYALHKGYLKVIGTVKISDKESSTIFCCCGETFAGKLNAVETFEAGLYELYHKDGGFLGFGEINLFRKIDKIPSNMEKSMDFFGLI